ncbi:hypothetical protein R6Q59_002800 [Mikania micrantha]
MIHQPRYLRVRRHRRQSQIIYRTVVRIIGELMKLSKEEVDVGVGMVMIDDKIKDSCKTEVEISVEMAKLNPLLVVALKKHPKSMFPVMSARGGQVNQAENQNRWPTT